MDLENIDIKRLKEDMIDYFSTAINPFDVDLMGIQDLDNYSLDKIVEFARQNGFNISLYKIDDDLNYSEESD